MNVTVSKNTAEGEAVTLEFTYNGKQDAAKLNAAFDVVDARLREMNERYLEALKTIEEFPPDYRLKARYLADCLHGHRLDQLTRIPHLRVVEGGKPGGAGEEATPGGTPQGS